MRVIFLYSKYGMARFISSRDTVRAIERNFRRAKIPMIFTEGFHPHPILSFLDSMPVGVVNRALYFSVEVESWDEEMFKELKSTSVEGLEPMKFWVSEANINSLADSYRYEVFLEKAAVDISRLSKESLVRKGKKETKYKLRELTEDLKVVNLKRYYLVKYTSKREKVFSPWEIIKLVKAREGIFLPILEEVMCNGIPLRIVLEG